MSDEIDTWPALAVSKATQLKPETKKRLKKPPLIDFNALDAHQQKTIHNIATAGAWGANAQQRI